MNASDDITPASYGTDGVAPPILPVATHHSSQLSVFFEWAGILPLAIYLAGTGFSHRLVGRTALAGFITVSLFPRLGVLESIAAFLREGADFVDRASSISELRRTVWDANFGSVFPCANGAASDILARHVIRSAREVAIPQDLAELTRAYELGIADGGVTEEEDGSTKNEEKKKSVAVAPFRRYQTLYIIDCTINAERRKGVRAALSASWLPNLVEVVVLLLLLGACAVAALFGLYGTAAAILLSAVFRATRSYIQVITPPGYMENNEPNQVDGCMLAAIHENASTWYLYRGSRAVVDGLLNKPMILDITARPNTMLAFTLRALAVFQIVTMTYVAAQKGWDGVGLLVLIVVAWTLDYVLYNDDKLADGWLRRENVSMKAWKCRFSGRTAMLGSIQVLKTSNVASWMDQILAPSDRREAWLRSLLLDRLDFEAPEKALTEKEVEERKWVKNNWLLTRAAVTAIRDALGEGSA
ncbi:uncharacterized protein TRIREDRAFT_108683 [Trichoderma reesei QM6a]|jgi:hypothetical protein|uniref:Predicted protein n=2 Tax=Hypocrea jecorina TaxID=51453 RepID=G0RN37_HYPJQ|nr:uncharacterized protein TRIREDRAFT_108683 [Trichoderma reesei QM6a]EGR47377.1 predicted protein [Trichoderma reesei QM6a]